MFNLSDYLINIVYTQETRNVRQSTIYEGPRSLVDLTLDGFQVSFYVQEAKVPETFLVNFG